MLLCGIAQLIRGTGGHQGGGGEMADGIGGQVAVGHLASRLGCLPGLDHAAAQLARSGVVTEDARIDMQQFHGDVS
ncbi:hypothetical protein D9M71_214730 [compost metagenome]